MTKAPAQPGKGARQPVDKGLIPPIYHDVASLLNEIKGDSLVSSQACYLSSPRPAQIEAPPRAQVESADPHGGAGALTSPRPAPEHEPFP